MQFPVIVSEGAVLTADAGDEDSTPVRGVPYNPSALRLGYHTAYLGQDQPGEPRKSHGRR
jgi:hypothetical protein